jgi:dTDP-4-amino-4,6-dideoxygalactose transaminase
VVECGFKYNMSDLAAAVGLAQLARLDDMVARRKAIVDAYLSAFAGVPEIEVPPGVGVAGHCWHLFVLRLNLERLAIDRGEFLEQLRSRGIGSSVHFIPIPLHSYYRRTLELRDPCKRALTEYPRLLSLPLYPGLSDLQVARIIAAVLDVVRRNRRQTVVVAHNGGIHDAVETGA